MADPITQNNFNAGELSPHLYGRTDLAKYHAGAMFMRNCIPDYRGGVASRPGTQFIGLTKDNSTGHLQKFVFSGSQTYMLVFTAFAIQIIKNPLTASGALNGTNTGFIETSPGVRYTIVTPYDNTVLGALKFTQSADVMIITHPSFVPKQLTRITDTNWTLADVAVGSTSGAPTSAAASITGLPSGSTDPQNTHYAYCVTAIDDKGQESVASNIATVTGINIATTQGTVTITWTAPVGITVKYYNVYKATPNPGGVAVVTGAPLGFIGDTTATSFTDPNIVADFSQTPPTNQNPFTLDGDPSVSAYFQQRRVYGGSNAKPLTIDGSRPAQYNNFDTSNPTVDSDAFSFTINDQEVNQIRYLLPMPGGLVVFTDGGVQQLTGGSSNPTNPTAVTPSSAVMVPQSSYGAADGVPPIRINYDILYVQSEGSIVRDLSYNFFVNIYTGSDLTILSSHLFYPNTILDWAYQDVPYKIIWAIRNTAFGGNNDTLLSLTYLKEQDIYGWAHHDTSNGIYISIESVREGSTDAVYILTQRANGNFCIERMCSQLANVIGDCWCLDCALFNDFVGSPVSHISGLDHLNDQIVNAFVDGVKQGPFVVTAGAINLTTPGNSVLVGLSYTCQFQQLPPSAQGSKGEGKRTRDVDVSIQLMNTGPGLKYGRSFNTLLLFRPGITSTDTDWDIPYPVGGLYNTEIHAQIPAKYSTQGGVCIQMDDPLPFTITALVVGQEGLR